MGLRGQEVCYDSSLLQCIYHLLDKTHLISFDGLFVTHPTGSAT